MLSVRNPVPAAEVIAAAEHTVPEKHTCYWHVGN